MSAKPNLSILLLLFALALAPSISTHAVLPALPAVQKHFGVGTGVVQLTISMAMLSIACMTLIYGLLADKYGRRPALILGMAGFLVGSVICLVAQNIWLLIFGRILQAGGASAGMIVVRTIARDLYGASRIAQVMSYLIMATVVGSALAPAAGGLLTDEFGWRSVFAASTAYGLFAFLAVLFQLAETKPVSGDGQNVGRLFDGFRRVVRIREFWAYVLTSAASMAMFFAFLAAAPYLMSDVLGHPARVYGFWFISVSIAYFLGTFTSSRLMRTRELIPIIKWGVYLCLVSMILTAIAMAAMPLSSSLLFLPASVISFFLGLIIANGTAGAMNVDAGAIGSAAGLTSFLQMSVCSVVAQMVGIFENGTVWPMIIAMLAASVIAVVASRLLR